MEKNPLVSVIVPYYNSEEQLERCADSLSGQTYRNLEILFVNDGSEDGSAGIVRKLAEKDPRIINIDIPHSGVSVARNTGLEKSSGSLILFADSDDWMNRAIIERMVRTIEETEADIVTCELERTDVYRVPEITESAGYDVYNRDEYLRLFFKIQQNVWVHFPVGKLCRKEILSLPLYPPSIRVGEDVIGTYRAITKAEKIVRLRDTGYYYYTNPQGVTTRFSEKDFDLIRVWDEMVRLTEGTEPDHTYAVINRNRINFTLLFRMITEMPASEIKDKFSVQKEQLLRDLREAEKDLLASPIVLSRKVMIFSLCRFYPVIAFFGNVIVHVNRRHGRTSGFSRRKLS